MTMPTITPTLCLRLKELRKQARMSAQTVSARSGIALVHVQALESCDYDQLPVGNVRKAMVKKYVETLGVREDEIAHYLHQLQDEKKISPPSQTHQRKTWRMSIRSLALASVMAVIMLYLGAEVRAMIGPPKLLVNNPINDVETNIPTIEIAGETIPESHVTINGVKIALNTDGFFNETIHLKEGLNEIIIIAQSKRGGQAHVERTVLYTPDVSQSASIEKSASQL